MLLGGKKGQKKKKKKKAMEEEEEQVRSLPALLHLLLPRLLPLLPLPLATVTHH